MADHLQRKMKKDGLKGVTTEGLPNCDWVLIDGGDVIVHLFRPEVRDFYSLEKIWAGPKAPGAASGVTA
jgi:ribosome-associated protein